MNHNLNLLHPMVSRRTAVQAGAIGLLGMGSNHLRGVRAADSGTSPAGTAAMSNCGRWPSIPTSITAASRFGLRYLSTDQAAHRT